MQRYAAFAFDNYYPEGGWNDFIGSFDTVEEARIAVMASAQRLSHIVDLQTGKRCED